jgi:predicted nuclease of predicted toxin-antitoxin system
VALRFKLDENIPGEAVALLRDAGHDVSTALEQGLGGAVDERVLGACRDEARVLVTLDLDFGDIRAYPPASHAGVWVLRPNVQSIGMLVELLRGALALAATEPVSSRLWVIEPGQVRIRG